MRLLTVGLAAAAMAVIGPVAGAQGNSLPTAILPDGLGVNIHFTDPRAGEMKMLSEGGFRWIRMDYNWDGVEREKGKYDFSAYDRLMAALDRYKVRALFILDYSNRNYDNGQSPSSEEGRKGFARWAAASVRHFKGRGILWEMYNEPNGGFWRPKPDVEAYAKLALEVGKAIRATGLKEDYIGPATSGIDMNYLESCFKAGLLEYWDAVSVHPYRQADPETAAPEYRRLRTMIARYAPKGKRIPILSGEWGYSSAWGGMGDDKQGRYLPREWMTDIMCDVPLSIWYDWHDDGLDPKEPEHHFGTTNNPYHEGQDPVYTPKPSYLAARAFTRFVEGCRYSKRLAVGGANDYVLLFEKAGRPRLAVWTTSLDAHDITVPASDGAFRATTHLGEDGGTLTAAGGKLVVPASVAPLYLTPEGSNDLLSVATAVGRAPLEVSVDAPAPARVTLAVHNPLSHDIRVKLQGDTYTTVRPGATVRLAAALSVARSTPSTPMPLFVDVAGLGRIPQGTDVLVANPLIVTFSPLWGRGYMVTVDNPSGQPFAGAVTAAGSAQTKWANTQKLSLTRGETIKTIAFQAPAAPDGPYTLGASVLDAAGRAISAASEARLAPMAGFADGPGAFGVYPDGDMKIASQQSLTPEQVEWNGVSTPGLTLTYSFATGWKFVRVSPNKPELRAIEGKPKAYGLFVKGDGQGNVATIRYADSTGQTFQAAAQSVTWNGWRFVVFPLDGHESSFWGGANDGILHYPIRWDTVFLLDGRGKETKGSVSIANPTVIY